ncbi:uncharacterized protein LOC130187429 isoform X1 [Seriola aureovittata]|uniref:uncharacterized protein LOC130187429 isoform X1 n=1 Tax=Seriola aureovittata TaxID=2871759 RepID=UPI0024BD95BA|nr:uncharacterized protein LOC130187429 isoform X1 [Seriola aureovittata]
MYQGEDVDTHHRDLRTSQSGCWASVNFEEPRFIHELLKCNVTHKSAHTGVLHHFTFSSQSSGETTGETTGEGEQTTTTAENTRSVLNTTSFNDASSKQQGRWLVFITVAAGLVMLLIIVVLVIKWKRTEGNRTQRDHSAGLSLNQETRQDTADPEDGVSYSSVIAIRMTNSKAQVRRNDDDDDDDDEGDPVIYSNVKTSSSSDPSSMYSNFPNI